MERSQFERYLAVVNRSLQEQGHHFPYNQLMQSGQRQLGRRSIEVRLYDERTDTELPVIVRVQDGRFVTSDSDEPMPRVVWRVRQSHVNEVVADPGWFVREPSQLEFGWLHLTSPTGRHRPINAEAGRLH
jgi:hypothetical protein